MAPHEELDVRAQLARVVKVVESEGLLRWPQRRPRRAVRDQLGPAPAPPLRRHRRRPPRPPRAVPHPPPAHQGRSSRRKRPRAAALGNPPAGRTVTSPRRPLGLWPSKEAGKVVRPRWHRRTGMGLCSAERGMTAITGRRARQPEKQGRGVGAGERAGLKRTGLWRAGTAVAGLPWLARPRT